MSESANFADIDRSNEAPSEKERNRDQDQDKKGQNGALSPADSTLAGDFSASSQKDDDDDAMVSTALSAAAAASAAAAKYKESRKKASHSKNSSKYTNTIQKHRHATKKAKDMPLRPLSAYNYFFKEERTRVLAEREAAWVGQTTAVDADVVTGGDAPNDNRDTEFFATLGETIARRWKGLPEKDRKRFYAMAADDLARYRLEMKLHYDNYNEAISSATAHYKAGEIGAFQALKRDSDSSNTLSSNATGASSLNSQLKPHHLNLQFANQSQTRTDTTDTRQRSLFTSGMSRLAYPGTSSSSESQFFGRHEGLHHTDEANRLNLPTGEIEQQQLTHQSRMLCGFYNQPLNSIHHQHHSGSKSNFVSFATSFQRQKGDQQQAAAPWSVAAEQSSSSSRLLMDALLQCSEPSPAVSSASQAMQQMSKQQHGHTTNHHQLLQQLQEQQPHLRSTDIFSIILPPQHQDQGNRGISTALIPGQFLQTQSNPVDWSQLLTKANSIKPPNPPDASFDPNFPTALLSSHDRYELEDRFLTASDQTNRHFAQFSSATSGGAASSSRGSDDNMSNLLQQRFSVPSLSPSDSIMIPQLDQHLQSLRQDQQSMELSASTICPRQAAGLLCFCTLCTARI